MKEIVRIFKVARELWGLYAFIGVATVVLSAMSLVMPLVSGWVIDEIQRGSEARLDYVVWLAFVIFVLDFLQNVLSNWSGYWGDVASARVSQILSSKYYAHLLTLPQSYFDNEQSGKIINRLNRSIQQIANFMKMMSNNLLQFMFTTVFSLIVVAIYSWQVALLLGLLYPIYIVLTMRNSPVWQDYQKKKNFHADVASGRFAEVISQIKVVKSFVQEPREHTLFLKNMKEYVRFTRPQSRFWHVKDFQRRVVLNVIFFGVYVLIFTQAVQGAVTPGQAVALILYAMQIRIPIFTISFLVDNTQRAIADSRDYFAIMDTPSDRSDTSEHVKGALNVERGEIEFNHVSFGYEKGQDVLRDITFRVDSGSKAAIVGESGQGKTTITHLLLRLYQPQKGAVLIDGQDINTVSRSSLMQTISVVFQEPALFSGTIRENIAYARPDASDEDVKKAAKAANAHEFIRHFEKGYDSEIGERGLKLSGGQKQRLAIARAILKDAPILILDEATSSLDSKSEALVQQALERLMKGRTTLMIAHRLSTIQRVDTIVTLKHGRVDEVGSPEELSKTGGLYETLLQLQSTTNPEARAEALKKYDFVVAEPSDA